MARHPGSTECYDSAPKQIQEIIDNIAAAMSDSLREVMGIEEEDGAEAIWQLREGMARYLHDAGIKRVLRIGRSASILAALAINQARSH